MHTVFFQGVFCWYLLVIHVVMEARAQTLLQGPFQYAQLGFLDSTAGMSTYADFFYPAAGLRVDKTALISMGKLVELPGWTQLVGQYLYRKKHGAVGLQFSFDKQLAVSETLIGIQLAQSLANEVDVGAILGIKQATYVGYKKNKMPFANLGVQTFLGEKVMASFALRLAQQGLVAGEKRFVNSIVLAATQLNINPSAALCLHVQKVEQFPMEWMALVSYRPARKIYFQCGFSPSPQWWSFQFSYLLGPYKAGFNTSVHPLTGLLALFSLQTPSKK